MAYKSVGSTTHYSISYDDSLSKADGENRANDLKGVCERDFGLMGGWFAGVTLTVPVPIEVRIELGPGTHARWGPPTSLFPGDGSTLDVVRSLLVAEVTEMFMMAQDKGYYYQGDRDHAGNEGSNGEGLSKFLTRQFLILNKMSHNPGGIGDLWLNGGRSDWVSKTDLFDHSNSEKSGCSVLFLWYLNVQLGFDINTIVAAAAPTLSGVYKNLTKDPVDPFSDFKQVLDDAFPATNPNGTPKVSSIPGSNPDNPFPLRTPRSLSVIKYRAALPPNQCANGIRALINKGGMHTLRPTLNSNRRTALV